MIRCPSVDFLLAKHPARVGYAIQKCTDTALDV